MSDLRKFIIEFTETALTRIRAMNESEATSFLRSIQAGHTRQEEQLASLRSITSEPTDDDDLGELKAWLNSRPRQNQTAPDWFHVIEEAVRARLKELGTELE